MSLTRVPMPSPNYSSRDGSGVRLAALHTTQGASTIESLGNFFASSSSGVSSHAGADDKPNTIAVFVTRQDKAWTQGDANPYCVSLEMCAWAEWSTAEWHNHPTLLANAAAWMAEEAAAFGIPLRALTAAEAQGGAAGICQHADLGAAGGGHWDCGPGFPMAEVLQMAQGGGTTPPPMKGEAEMVIVRAPSGSASTFDGVKKMGITDPGSMKALQDAGIQLANVSQAYYDRIPNA